MKIKDLLILFALTLLPVHLHGGGYAFRWKLEKGKEYTYRTVSTVKGSIGGLPESEKSMEGLSAPGEFSTTSEFLNIYHILDKDKEGVYTIRITYGTIRMTVHMGSLSFTYTSDDSGTLPPQYSWLKALKGKSIILRINERGETLDVTGFDELLKEITEELHDAPEGAFDPGELRKSFRTTIMAFPSRHLNKGEGWEDSFNLSLQNYGNVMMKNHYTFEGMQEYKGERCGLFSTTTDMNVDLAGSPAIPLPMDMRFTGGKGRIIFSHEKGLLREGESRIDYEMKMNIPGSRGGEGAEMKMQMHISTKTELME